MESGGRARGETIDLPAALTVRPSDTRVREFKVQVNPKPSTLKPNEAQEVWAMATDLVGVWNLEFWGLVCCPGRSVKEVRTDSASPENGSGSAGGGSGAGRLTSQQI